MGFLRRRCRFSLPFLLRDGWIQGGIRVGVHLKWRWERRPQKDREDLRVWFSWESTCLCATSKATGFRWVLVTLPWTGCPCEGGLSFLTMFLGFMTLFRLTSVNCPWSTCSFPLSSLSPYSIESLISSGLELVVLGSLQSVVSRTNFVQQLHWFGRPEWRMRCLIFVPCIASHEIFGVTKVAGVCLVQWSEIWAYKNRANS